MAKMLRMFNSLRRNKEKKRKYKRSNSTPHVELPNGHPLESGGSLEKVQDTLTDGRSSDPDKSEHSDSSVIFLETYGVDPQLLRNDVADEHDEAEANQDPCPDSDTSSVHSLVEFGLELNSESRYSVGSDEETYTDQSSQTDTSTDTLVLDGPLSQADLPSSSECPFGFDENVQADIEPIGAEEQNLVHSIKRITLTGKEDIRGTSEEYPNDFNEFDSFLQKQSDEDASSGTDSFFSNFEEKLEQVELQFPNLQVEHLLADEVLKEDITCSSLWALERSVKVTRSANITEEREGVEETSLKPSHTTKLETNMGQYYSSVSGAEASKGGDISGSLPSSPRSSEGWRISMASTATVGSSATVGSDDTVAKDMSELSSVNSRLSDLDETRMDGKTPPSAPTAPDPDATPKVTPVLKRKKQTSIKDAIDELESIEQAAQTLLLKRQCSSEDERLTPVPGKDSPALVSSSCSTTKNEKMSPQGRRKVIPSPPPPLRFADDPYTLPEGDAISDKLDKSLSSLESSLQAVDKEITDRHEASVVNGSSSPKLLRTDQGSDAKAEVKPPLPPTAASVTAAQQPKVDVKRRLLSKSKEVQLYISRESYNEERVLKELEKLRRSFQENDLNDFLDALDNTAIEDDIEEAFLTQLLEDLREDVEALPAGSTENADPEIDDVVFMTESSSEVSSDEANQDASGLSSASSKLEKVREKISERIRKRKASKSSDSGSSETTGTTINGNNSESSKLDSSGPDTPQADHSAAPQPTRPETSDLFQTPDIAKAEDTKKGFNIAQFLKKGSPKYLRKKYKERKNRKSDLITTSESESEDPEAYKKEANGSVLKSQSNLKGSNRSLNGTQDTKKEVRFDLDSDVRDREIGSCLVEKTTGSNTSKNLSSNVAPTGPAAVSGSRLVTCEARQQETVVLKEAEESTQEVLPQQTSPQQPSFPLPVVVEDINSRAESLLPKLPERVKPPRRKKMIPTPVEELSSHPSGSNATNKAGKVTDARTEFLKNMTAGNDESPLPLPHYEEPLNAPKSPSAAVEGRTGLHEAAKDLPDFAVQEAGQQPLGKITVSVPVTSSASASPQPPSSTTLSGAVISGSMTEDDASVSGMARSEITANDPNVPFAEEVLVAPIPVTSVAPISVASPEATKVVYPPRTLPLPAIQECVHEDQVSLPTPSDRTTISSYGDTTPATPPFEGDKLPSLYDNVNPFKEMLKQENLPEDWAFAKSTQPTHQSQEEKEMAAEVTEQRSHAPTKRFEDLSLPQVARKSPETEKPEIVDIDALAALTAEMFKFAEEMEKDIPMKSTRPPFRENTNSRRRDAGTYTSRRTVETREVGTEPETSHQTSLVKKTKKSNTIGIQTDNTRYVRTYEAASQTDTEYETETESEMEDNMHKKYDASKWTFGPTREQTLPLPSLHEPQLGHIHKQQQRLIQELQKQTAVHQEKEKAKPEAPPRHYQDKMPLKVVAELKNVLSDLEDSKPAPSRKMDQPPRWDSQLSWPHDDLATGTREAGLPGAREVGGTDDRQQTKIKTPGPPAAPARKPQTLPHLESQNKQVKGNEGVEGRSAGIITKIRANVYPSFAPVTKVPTGKPPVPRSTLRRLSADGQAAEEGYQSDPGGRRSNGRHRQPPLKIKLPYQIVEDRGYATDTEVVFKKAAETEKTLRSTWTPIGQLSPPELSSEGATEQALQELGLDESTLLNEIEQILGVGSLTSKSEKGTDASPARPEKPKSPVKPRPDPGESGKPRVPERDSSRGVWSPGRTEKDNSGPSKIDLPDLPSFKDQPNVWTPARAGSASPSLGRKEYRKIAYDTSSSPQRRPSQENVTVPSPEESFAWKDANVDKVARSPTSTLPKVQNPTVTLLQKKREGQIPGHRPEYLKPDDGPKYRPDDKLYVIKREYESEEEGGGGRRFAVLGPKKVTGVGPTTNDGVPTTLKSGVKSEHQGEWYKRMFDSLHKIKDDDHIIIKYKVPRARYGGYMSEPEGYDSDIGGGTLRYATVDRRHASQYEADPMTSSLPRNASRYVHQPGRIEDYVPGYSSLAEKELKRSQSQEPPPVSVNHRFGSQKMSMTHALKESGYESDSTLVFKKREDARRLAPDPRKTSQVYRQIQRGGDIPITGLQKPNPPRPKESPYKYESGEVNIHYRTPVRIEQKESIPEEELARRQEEHMKKVYENERRKKYLAELEDIERRRHTDNFTPLQKSPIPLNRYDDESSLGTMRGVRTPDLKQVAKALYNFSAQNKRELSFNKGDVVFIRRQIDKNWYEGEHRGSVGIFPCNYVEIVPYDSIRTLTRKPTEGQARARFNFQAQTSMEMSLSKGELVVLTRRVDENWYEGRIGNRKGIFPVSYVDTLMEPGADRPLTPSSSPMPRPALPAANLLYNGASSYSSPYSTLGRPGSQNDSRPYHQSLTVNTQQEPVPYRALYNYKPQNDDELELLENDVVMVMEKCDDGWFVGTSRRTGLFGTFPGNYVERV